MNSVQMTITTEHDIAEPIRGFFMQQFPVGVAANKDAKVDLVTDALVSNGQVRFGPAPTPEGLNVIRAVVQCAIDRGAPIPILTPWGSKKPENDASIDIAEMGALKQLACLQARVQQHYEPGVQIRLRIEDASGYHLYADEEGSAPAIDRYTKDFCDLVRVMGLHFIEPVPENSLFSADEFATRTNEVAVVMDEYLKATEGAADHAGQSEVRDRLRAMTGIRGDIAPDQREYYYRLYRGLYQGIDQGGLQAKLAQYLSGALVRNKIGGRGEDPSWKGKYVQVTFAPPVPGSPPEMVRHFLYYRALPSRSAHTPPWRAKGYFEMRGRQATPKVASWRACPAGLGSCVVELNNGNSNVAVTADYVVMG